MANRYWVGGTAAWDGTAGTKWSTTSGGVGGAAVPTASDDVFFSVASGIVTISINIGVVCRSLDMTGFIGTMAGSGGITMGDATAGNLTFGTGMTRTYTGSFSFVSTTTGNIITLNGKTLASAITFNGSGGAWSLADAFNTSSTIGITVGTVTSSNTVNCTTLTVSSGATFNLGGNVTLSGALSIAGTLSGSSYSVSGGTTVAGAGTINLSLFSGSTCTVNNGSNYTFGTLTLSGAFSKSSLSAGNCTIGSGGMTCTTFSWAGSLTATGTFTSGSGLINCSGQATFNGGVTSVITIGSGGMTCANISGNSGSFTFNMGSGNITLNGTTATPILIGTSATINGQTSNLIVSDTSAVAKNVSLQASTGNINNLTISGDNITLDTGVAGKTMATLAINNAGLTNGFFLVLTNTYTITALTTNGSAGNLAKLASNSSGNPATISCANPVSVDYMSIKDSTASGNTPFYAGTHSTNVSGNTNWSFTAPPTPPFGAYNPYYSKFIAQIGSR